MADPANHPRMSREDEVLLKIARNSNSYRSARLNSLDEQVARNGLIHTDLAYTVAMDLGGFCLTEKGLRRAEELVRHV